MYTYSLDYESGEGMKIIRYNGQEESDTINIPPEPSFPIKQPSRRALKKKFLKEVTPEDIVLSPGGSNYTILQAVFQRTEQVFWLPSQFVDDQQSVPQELYERWQRGQEEFYQFQETTQITREIKQDFELWMHVEKERIALSNTLSRLLRRLRDDILLSEIPRQEFIEKYVAQQKSLIRGVLGSVKEDVEAKQAEKDWSQARQMLDRRIEVNLKREAKQLYQAYSEGSKKKDIRNTEQRVIDRRLSILKEVAAEMKNDIKAQLKQEPFREIYENLTGVGPRFLGGLIAKIRNPLLYPSVEHLLGYFNLLPYQGQRRTRTQASQMGGARFEAETLIYEWTDQPAFFSNEDLAKIYRAYKAWRWIVYYPLYVASQNIFDYREKDKNPYLVKDLAGQLLLLKDRIPMIRRKKKVKKKLRSIWGSGSKEELIRNLSRSCSSKEKSKILLQAELPQQLEKINLSHCQVKEVARRIEEVTDNNELLNRLPHIRGTGTWKELWQVVSRAGCNIQMTPQRLERISRREVGIQVVKYTYYWWLRKELKKRSGISSEQRFRETMNKDSEYLMQADYSSKDPYKFQLPVVGRYYIHKAREAAREEGYRELKDIPEVIRDSCGEQHLNNILNL